MVQTRSGKTTGEISEFEKAAKPSAPWKRKGIEEASEEKRPKKSKKAVKKEDEAEPEVEISTPEKEGESQIIEKGLIYFFYKPKVLA